MSLLAEAPGPWPAVSLIIFLVLFIGMLAWLFLVPSARWKRDARMPLEEAPVEAHKKETQR
jgi:hypothetical protein